MMATFGWSPFRELGAMERRMRRMFSDLELTPRTVPAADLYEMDDEVVFGLVAPGFDKQELSVEVTDHTLSIKGERNEEKEEKEKAFYRRERLERSFERRFELPAETDPDKITASFAKGVLTIQTPRAIEAAAKAKKVAIEVKKD